VGDAAGKASDALHLLRLREPRLDQPAIGDVARDAQMPVREHARAIAALDEPHRAAARSHLMLARRFAEREQFAPRREHRLGAVDHEGLERLIDDGLAAEAEHRARGRIRFDDGAIVVEDQHGVRCLEKDRPGINVGMRREGLFDHDRRRPDVGRGASSAR